MPLMINANISSLNVQRHLARSTAEMQRSAEKLSSGYRINRASDDAAGLQLSESLRTQIRGSKKALENTQDGINFLQVADGALVQMGENLQRVRELMVQAANDTYSTTQRASMQAEVTQLFRDIDRLAASTQYNGIFMFDTQFPVNYPNPGGIRLQIGPGSQDSLNMNQFNELGDMTTNNIGMVSWNAGTQTLTVNMNSGNNIRALMNQVDNSLNAVNGHRANIGALINRLEGAVANLQNSIENNSAAESRLRDVDVAAESAKLTRNRILQQAATTLLAQANQQPSIALQLLQASFAK